MAGTAKLRGCTLGKKNGRIVVKDHGMPVSQAVYCDYILRGDWKERNEEFVQSGVKVFHLTLAKGHEGGGKDFFDNALWSDVDVYPETDHAYTYNFDHQANTILAMEPEAKFFIKATLTPPSGWAQKYADHMQTDESGEKHREASWASEQLLTDLRRYLENLVRFCESREWGDRILGYLLLPLGEGIMPLCCSGHMFDCSPANDEAFRAWVKRHYKSEDALRLAWNDPTVRFNTVRVPRDSEWLHKKATTPATLGGALIDTKKLVSNCQEANTGLFHFVEPQNVVYEHDYCRHMREAFIRWVRMCSGTVKAAAAALGRARLVGMDIIKQPQIGWVIQSTFDGVGDGHSFPSIFALSGSTDMGELIDEETLDVVWTPADYFARTVGFAYEAEGLTDSMALRGKVNMVENDTRCYVGAGVHDQGALRTPKEVEAGLLRNAAFNLSRNIHNYWCNVGSSYFHDKEIHKTIRKCTAMQDRLNTWEHRETEHAIAVVIDDTSPFFEDFTSGYQSLALIHQRVFGLAHCGVPYRLFLLSDLKRKNMPQFRTWLFPNLFKVDDNVMALLKSKVLRDGQLAIFGPATGITDGAHLGATQASALLGVEMELVARSCVRHVIAQDFGHRITRTLPASFTYGDSLPYGPTLVPKEWAVENAGATPLGHANTCWFLHRTGLFVNDFGKGASGNGKVGKRGKNDYSVVWSVAVPLPAELLRSCARYAGCNIWCEENDVIYASDTLASLHSVKSGMRTLQLPRACKVMDAVTNRPIGKGKVKSITFRVNAPQTRIFTLE